MKHMEVHGDDRPAREENSLEDMLGVEEGQNTTGGLGVGAMEEGEGMGVVGEREIWLQREQEDNLLDGNEASIFYTDFPPLPDFPSMSSSSSSSSTPAPPKPIASSSSSTASSSSSAASWAILRSDIEEDVDKGNQCNQQSECNQVDAPPAASSSTASMELLAPVDDIDCIDVMETFGYMDLIDGDEVWEPSSVFQTDNLPQDFQELRHAQAQQDQPMQHYNQSHNMPQGNTEDVPGTGRPFDELAVVFFEWLKSNKDHISAEDMRSIKLRRSTIDCASKRLGSTKEGQKQLLKLILEWVGHYQLQKKRMREASIDVSQNYREPFQNPKPNPSLDSTSSHPPDANTCAPSPWLPPPPTAYVTDPATGATRPHPQLAYPPMSAYIADPFTKGASVPPLTQPVNGHPYTLSTDYHMLNSNQPWPSSQFAMVPQYSPFLDGNNLPPAMVSAQPLTGYTSQFPYQVYSGKGERIMRLGPSATKEARKMRMARQRRLSVHHLRHHSNTQNQHQSQNSDRHARIGTAENCTNSAQANEGNWGAYWPCASAPTGPTVPVIFSGDSNQLHSTDRSSAPAQNHRQSSSDKRQGWKPEKNLKFLLQKVLKQSDVGNLGRIVLPKKEAETHLPELESRDGIPIAMEDIGTSKVWNMRYRFWPNNKSRMYLLENTGDFVRANGLQEGDFIVLYSDIKCGKYLIRGVKVRQQGPKSEGKRPARKNMCNSSSPAARPTGKDSSSSPTTKQTLK